MFGISARSLAVCAGVCISTAAFADFNFVNFASTSGLTLLGTAAGSGNALRITPSQGQVVGAAWHNTRQQVVSGFDTTFTFQLSEINGGADGFTFVIQGAGPDQIGEAGCRMAYHGMPNSLVIEFDTYANAGCKAGEIEDPDGNHISVHTLGIAPNSAVEAASIGLTSAIPNMKDGNVHTVRVAYNSASGALSIYIDNLTTPALEVGLDLAGTLQLDDGTAWVGFTGSCGGATENHDILSWSFTQGTGGPGPTGNHRPATPTITEPQFNGRIVNAADVHMETAPFTDEDAPPQTHVCTDWEIWTVNPPERVWLTACIGGVERVHTHLGDGLFLGSYAGRRDLIEGTDYRLRVRHRDSSADPATEWSFWSQRLFSTAGAGSPTPLETEDIVVPPTPVWVTDGGVPVELPVGTTPSSLILGSGSGDVLLSIVGAPGTGNTVIDADPLSNHIDVRVQINAGSNNVSIPPSTLRFLDHDCTYYTIYLPALNLAPNAQALFWTSVSGSTFVALPGQTLPDFNQLARASQLNWATSRPGFVVEQFATGFRLPVNIAFVPNPGNAPTDPYFYVTELYGTIKVVTRSGQISVYANNLLNFNPTGDFPGSGEQGLTGITVDPVSGDVFAGMLYSSVPGVEAANHYPKVVRFHSNDGGRTAATQTTILDMSGETQGQSHQISNFSIGPDGKLYVHMGDGFDASTAQNLSSFRGKMLRMNLDGTAPSDNPFYNGAPINSRDYVYVRGLRNPFGGAWRTSDSHHYEVENGPSVDRFARMNSGQNYLWDGSDQSMSNFAIYNWNPAHAPVNIVFVQPETFAGSGFPPSTYDHAFVTESGPTYGEGTNDAKRIVEFVLDPDGDLISGPATLAEYTGAGRGTAVGLSAGPDGLYFTDLYKDIDAATPIDAGASVWRIRYAQASDCNANGTPDWCDIATAHSADANANGVPDECEFCPADWNQSGTVNSQDFFDFLADFFNQNADYNHDGQTNSQDYFDFIAAFFTKC